MKRLVVLAILCGLLVPACGPSLQQLRSTVEPEVKFVDRDAFCVYNVLNSYAITKQVSPIWAQISWHSGWDPIAKKGLVYGQIEGYSSTPVMFEVFDEGNRTRLEMRIYPDTWGRYKKLARDIWDNADFSQCPKAGSSK